MKLKSKENLIVFSLFIAIIMAFIADPMMARAKVSDAPAAITQEHDVEVRTTQFNIFSIPLDSGSMVWEISFNRDMPTNKVTFSYRNPPRAMTEDEFAKMQAYAKQFIGVRYTYAGKNPSEGFDCSGFVLYVLSHFGSGLTAAGTKDQYTQCYKIPENCEMPGDIVFFTGTALQGNADSISHVGLYLGDGKMIHAGNNGIAVVDLSEPYYANHFLGFGRPF